MQTLERRQFALKLYFSGRIEGLSVYHHVLVAFAGWFFVFTVINDIYQATGTFILQRYSASDLVICIILNVIFISVFFVFPCAFGGWGLYHIKNHNLLDGTLFLLKSLLTIIGWIVSVFFWVLIPLAVFIFADRLIANTTLPLTTIFVGIVWLILGTKETRKLSLNRRIVIVTSMLLLILSVKYVDWSPKKSFVRDLLQIRSGMTGVQVETIMKNHQKNFVQSESEHFLHLNPEYTGETVFRDNGGDSIAVFTFQEGRVVNVVFDND